MQVSDWIQFHGHILQLEQKGLVTRTFRRLDPQRKEAVIGAILEEAAEKGPAAINIKKVAERAGVSVGSLYAYFDNRDGLLAFAVELCGRYLNDELNSFGPYLVNLPLREGLTWYMKGGLEWGRSQEGLVQFFARAAYQGDPELGEMVVRPIATTLREIVHEMLVRAAERGEIRQDVDLKAATRVIHALSIGVGDSLLLPYLNTYFQVHDDDLPFERTLEAMVKMIIEGIGRVRIVNGEL